jgi:hypothetical protein
VKRLAIATAIALALLSFAPHASAQQDFETLKKGFQPERLYHFAGTRSRVNACRLR